MLQAAERFLVGFWSAFAHLRSLSSRFCIGPITVIGAIDIERRLASLGDDEAADRQVVLQSAAS